MFPRLSRASLSIVMALAVLALAAPAGATAPATRDRSAPAPPAANAQEGFPPCGSDGDLGNTFTDEDGNDWVCSVAVVNGKLVFFWYPQGLAAMDEDTENMLYQGAFQIVQTGGYSSGFGGGSAIAWSATENDDGTPRIQPPGWLAQIVKIWAWNGSSWYICADPGQFTFNGASTSSLGGLSWRFGSPPCGAGWYNAESDTWAWDGGAWQGGGQILSPTNICLGCAAASARTNPAVTRRPTTAPPTRQRPPTSTPAT